MMRRELLSLYVFVVLLLCLPLSLLALLLNALPLLAAHHCHRIRMQLEMEELKPLTSRLDSIITSHVKSRQN